MKKLLLALLFMAVSVFAFSQWTALSSGTTNYLHSVFFTDTTTGYTVGYNGTIIKTTDGGINWTPQISGTKQHLNSVYFINSDIGYVVGDTGTILKTTNAGINWIAQTCGTTSRLFTVYFTDINNGYAMGWQEVKLKTTNAGETWTVQYSTSEHHMESICFTDANTGYAAGGYARMSGPHLYYYGKLIKTTDAGINWITIAGGSNEYYKSVFFTDANNGYVVGWDGLVLKTTNAGAGWSRIYTGVFDLYSVYFTNNTNGYASGFYGIYRTTNSGLNWVKESSQQYLYSIFFPDGYIGYSVGGGGVILKTTNGGAGFYEANNSQESLFTVYPNPATDKICITSSALNQKETIVDLFNIHGILLLSNTFALQNSLEIDVSSLAKGVYIIKIQAGDGFEMKKLVIQ